MQNTPLFYKKIVPLNVDQHINLYLDPIEGYAFTRETNSLYIAAVEFHKASKEYLIVFSKNPEQAVFPMILLGLHNNENLYINGQGEWQAEYIPAYVRRYPFILASSSNTNTGEFTVCIDENFPGFNTAKEGQRLYTKKGYHSVLLKKAVEFLKDFHKHVQITESFCKNLDELGLLEPMEANISLKNGEKLAMGGFFCINRKRLKELEPEKQSGLIRTDQMELIYAHLRSLENLNVLINHLN